MKTPLHFGTRAIHAGESPCPVTGALDTPIYQSSTYASADAAELIATYSGQRDGFMYTRYGNPTIAVLEAKLADLEQCEACIATSSGMAAISTALLSSLKQGDHIVAARTLYGGTLHFMQQILPDYGIQTTFVDSTRPDAFAAAIRSNTRVLYLESPANPTLELLDLSALGRLARERGLLSMIDNTFATPWMQRPSEHGIDLILHSATKYLCGHGDAMGGAIVGPAALVNAMRKRLFRDLGGVISPLNAWLILRGIHTLHVRMPVHCANALALARWLEQHPQVLRVNYPGLESHPDHALAQAQMRAFGAIISFEVRGGLEAGKQVMDRVRLFARAASLGDVRSLIVHSASTSHAALTASQRLTLGITDGLVRLSVGLEVLEDLQADLEQAIAQR